MSRIHYRGPVADHRGSKLGGWAACCSGERAFSIEKQGLNTLDPTKVTCSNCLHKMRSHVKYWSDPARTERAVQIFMDQCESDPRALVRWLKGRS